jgi:hypothetical protein
LRTAKIQLLMLLNERTPVEQFDVTGTFDYSTEVRPLEEFRNLALENRPDLKAAVQSIEKAQTDHKLAVANGSTDPTFRRRFCAQSADSGVPRSQRYHSAAHLRPESRREADAPSRTSRATNGCATRPPRKCSATWIPLTPLSKAI